MAQQEPIFAVRAAETLNKFEASFVDYKSGVVFTTSFSLGEPVIYKCQTKAVPTLTHISHIGTGYFTCGTSTSGRMIPTQMAQSALHLKLTLNVPLPSMCLFFFPNKLLDFCKNPGWAKLAVLSYSVQGDSA